MKTSENQKTKMKSYEGLHDGDLSQIGLQPKLCPADIWTVGWGHAVYDKTLGRQLKGSIKGDFERIPKELLNMSLEEADQLFDKDLSLYEKMVNVDLKVPVNQNQYDALVSHRFNCGFSSTIYRMINKGEPKEDLIHFWQNHYITAGGGKSKGLINRRKEECELFFS